MKYPANAVVNTIPAASELRKVSGFDPLKFLKQTVSARTGQKVLKLELPYKQLWFRLACPNGRMLVKPLRVTDQIAIFEAMVYQRITNQLDFEQNGMRILYPASPDDIIAEGQALHHCVGGYVDRVAREECIILFLRQTSQLEKPFYTIEVRNQEVVQVRGDHNTEATNDVTVFMKQWEAAVLQQNTMPVAA